MSGVFTGRMYGSVGKRVIHEMWCVECSLDGLLDWPW